METYLICLAIALVGGLMLVVAIDDAVGKIYPEGRISARTLNINANKQ